MNMCPICGRPLDEKSIIQFHHLIPKTFKGKDGIDLHKVCHQKIHATFTERELQHYYHTVERIVEHEEMIKFIKWIQKKPTDYYSKNDETNIRYGKRRK